VTATCELFLYYARIVSLGMTKCHLNVSGTGTRKSLNFCHKNGYLSHWLRLEFLF